MCSTEILKTSGGIMMVIEVLSTSEIFWMVSAASTPTTLVSMNHEIVLIMLINVKYVH